MIGIYKITSPTGKIYIGQSTDIENRKSHYKNYDCKTQPAIYNSLKKHGWENHTFEILEECDIKVLGQREKYWKIYFNSVKEGLNCRLDEEAGGYLEQSTKDKISKALKGRDITRWSNKIYTKNRNSKVSKSLKGKLKTQAHKDKISLTKTGKPNVNKRVPVLQYDLQGNFIKEWESQKQAALILNINYQGINNCMLGKTKSSNGFIWKKK
jgi:group I intron endonuclease